MATICSNRHIWRGSCNHTGLRRERSRPERPDAFVHRPETNTVNSSTERSTRGPPVMHFRRKIVIARVRRLALTSGSERSIKRGPRASKIVEDLERDSRSRHGHSPCRPSKRRDLPCFRLERQARQKQIDPAQTREGRSGRGAFAAMSWRSDSAATMNRYD